MDNWQSILNEAEKTQRIQDLSIVVLSEREYSRNQDLRDAIAVYLDLLSPHTCDNPETILEELVYSPTIPFIGPLPYKSTEEVLFFGRRNH